MRSVFLGGDLETQCGRKHNDGIQENALALGIFFRQRVKKISLTATYYPM